MRKITFSLGLKLNLVFLISLHFYLFKIVNRKSKHHQHEMCVICLILLFSFLLWIRFRRINFTLTRMGKRDEFFGTVSKVSVNIVIQLVQCMYDTYICMLTRQKLVFYSFKFIQPPRTLGGLIQNIVLKWRAWHLVEFCMNTICWHHIPLLNKLKLFINCTTISWCQMNELFTKQVGLLITQNVRIQLLR